MARSDPPDDVGTTLDEALSGLLRWLTRPDVRRSLLPDDAPQLSNTDVWLLGRLCSRGPARVSDLATWQGVDKSTMTAQVARLEQQGLVERRRDEDDRRVVLVAVTRRGRRVQERVRSAAKGVVEGLVDQWSPEERADLVRLLGKLLRQLDT